MKEEILPFVEPIYRFCLHRVSSRHDAEDLAGEIILHVLDGLNKYEIRSLEAWVWRVAHNRYARFCDARQRTENTVLWESAAVLEQLAGECDVVPEEENEDYDTVFRYLHTLSSAYRDLTVDYYIGGMSVKELSARHDLPETTVKWRLNVSRQKIRDRIDIYSKGDSEMDKIYKRINWLVSNNGDAMYRGVKYLENQVARAICEAAYEKPVTVEEISLATGLPTMYIEDALPGLIYTDAIEEIGGKYATNFIILRLKDREWIENQLEPLTGDFADFYAGLFAEAEKAVEELDFYGHDFGMKHLGYISVSLGIQTRTQVIKEYKNELSGLKDGPFPPRKDGGCGWFLIEEAEDSRDSGSSHSTGHSDTGNGADYICWYHIAKYFRWNIYEGGTLWLNQNRIPQQCTDGKIPDGLLTEDDIIRLLKANLIVKDGGGYKLNFACFTQEQLQKFAVCTLADLKNPQNNIKLDKMLEDVIVRIKNRFLEFTPKRLNSQINQWVTCITCRLTSYVVEELIARGVLETPDDELPLTNGVFYVEGSYMNA